MIRRSQQTDTDTATASRALKRRTRPRTLLLTILFLAVCGLLWAQSTSYNASWDQDVDGIRGGAEHGDDFGLAVAAGDFNCDGYQDVAIGVPHEDDSCTGFLCDEPDDSGAVNVIYSNGENLAANSPDDQLWTQNSEGVVGGLEDDDRFGYSLTAADFDGDGCTDLAIGVPGEDIDDKEDAGAVNVLYGSSSGLTDVGDQFWSLDQDHIHGVAHEDEAYGTSLAAGDFDGDGHVDLAIGIPGENSGEGAVSVLYANSGGLTDADQLWNRDSDDVKEGASTDDLFGYSLAAGDFNGDGYTDLAIGVPGDSPGGSVSVLYGSASALQAGGGVGPEDDYWHQGSEGIKGGLEDGDLFGMSLAAGDFNDDGYMDLAIGVPGEDITGVGTDAGAVNVIYGSSGGLTASGDQLLEDPNGNEEDEFGFSLAAGNFLEPFPGADDLVVGAPFFRILRDEHEDDFIEFVLDAKCFVLDIVAGNCEVVGGISVWPGTESGLSDSPVHFVSTQSDSEYGWALAAADIDRRGGDEIIVGAPSAITGTERILVDFDIRGGRIFEIELVARALPLSQDITVETQEDVPVEIVLLATDQDEDADLTFLNLGQSGNIAGASGTFEPFETVCTTQSDGSQSCTGTSTFTPAQDFNGTQTYRIAVDDRAGTEESVFVIVTIKVEATNDTPVMKGLTTSTGFPLNGVTVEEDSSSNLFFVSATDDGPFPLAIQVSAGPEHGTISATTFKFCVFNRCTQQFSYTPTADYSGSDSVSFQASDGSETSSAVAVNLTITPVPDAPIANATMAETDEDASVMISLSGSDADGDSLSYQLRSLPANGSVTLAGNVATYIPNTNFNGADSFSFRTSDGTLNSADANVGITVNAVNDAPVTNQVVTATNEDIPIIVALTGSDIDGDALTFQIVTSPSNGTLGAVTANGDLGALVTYNPAANFNGIDSFTFKANDGSVDSPTVTATLTVTPVNDPPAANNSSASTNEDAAVVINLTGGDIDSAGIAFAVVSGPSNGSLGPVSSTGPYAGQVTYTPDPDYFGMDSFTFKTADGALDSTTATANLTVHSVNDAPVITVITPADQTLQHSDAISNVTITAQDVDTNSLSVSIPALASNLTTAESCIQTQFGTSSSPGSVCSWTISGQMLEPAGSYPSGVTVSDGAASDPSGTLSFTVQPEDGLVTIDAENEVALQVLADGGDSGPFTLAFTLREVDDPNNVLGDANLAGDITNGEATMTLVPVGPGTPVPGACVEVETTLLQADPDSLFDYEELRVECSFAAGVPVNTYSVEIAVVGTTLPPSGLVAALSSTDGGTEVLYYHGVNTLTVADVFTIFDPSLGFTSGGGWFYWPGTGDESTGYSGDKTNFGYTMKYGNNGSKPKGSLLVIRHLPDGDIVRLKSNALEGLSLSSPGGDFSWAAFTGKGAYRAIGWPEPIGNHYFTVYAEDHGTAGAESDRFWIEVIDNDSLVQIDLSLPTPATDYAEYLKRGNVQVP